MLKKTDGSPERKEPVVVKKYANRRLYNTETSTYVTLDDLAAMVKSARDFVVYDAKTGDDLTHSVLTQIIVDQESRMGSETLLPIPFLRQLIRFYGDSVEKMVPGYLQASMDILSKEQERFRKQFNAFTPQGAFEAYQEQARKNLAMFEQAMSSMFKPFSPTGPLPGQSAGSETRAGGKAGGEAAPGVAREKSPSQENAAPARVEAKSASEELAEMKAQLAAMQAMITKLAGDKN